MLRLLHWVLRPFMRRVEEAMIRRLLSQRDAARGMIDAYRQRAGMRSGQFLEGDDT